MFNQVSTFSVGILVVVGALAGLGLYTFDYAEGLSYLSNDPAACRNCHIMNDQYDSWRKGPHHANATCNDCHIPQSFVAKYVTKAKNGFYHSKGFTLQDFHEPIQIKEENREIVQQSCLTCHGEFLHGTFAKERDSRDGLRCVHCHAGAGHGARK